uniref:Uncharacterized protein n=1 Tax=Cucumis melo TaxID=3656 RepID=A0A9I9E5F2_CUCME
MGETKREEEEEEDVEEEERRKKKEEKKYNFELQEAPTLKGLSNASIGTEQFSLPKQCCKKQPHHHLKGLIKEKQEEFPQTPEGSPKLANSMVAIFLLMGHRRWAPVFTSSTTALNCLSFLSQDLTFGG